MKDVFYITGNPNKARLFNAMSGLDIPHISADIEEIQELDLEKVVEHKVKAAYAQLKKPVIVEDTKLEFEALGRLPGPLIKWFLEELGVEGTAKILDGFSNRRATAGAAIAYYDGVRLKIVEKELRGRIAESPIGKSGFGWNRIFIPEGSDKTLGEFSDEEFKEYYMQIKPFKELADFIKGVL